MKNTLLRVGVVGISGYSGAAVLEILLKHPNVRVHYVSANNTQGPVSKILPKLANRTDLVCESTDVEKAASLCDVVFLAVPHTTSMSITPELLKKKVKVIDLSGDYRLESANVYEKWYGEKHHDSKNLNTAVYGLPELYREKIKKAELLSNPGCYPTAAILGLAPMVGTQTDTISSIIIDAKSGASGAGKKAVPSLMFAEVNENFKAYKVWNHQHTPEINQYLSRLANKNIEVTFTAHLLPITHGILETIYIQLTQKFTAEKIYDLYKKFYKTEPFVRVLKLGQQPEVKNVVGTNYCDIGLALNEAGNFLIVTSVIDNLIKGAAGQAVQNMNIMYGFPEDSGLI